MTQTIEFTATTPGTFSVNSYLGAQNYTHQTVYAVAAALGMPEPWRLDPCSLPLNDRRVQSL